MVCPLPALHAPRTADAASEHRKEVAQLMRGLARGLDELLGARPIPPAPRILCARASVMTHDGGAAPARIDPASRTAASRTDASREDAPRGEVIHLRPRQRILWTSANNLTRARGDRL
jgi:hypothetical protein